MKNLSSVIVLEWNRPVQYTHSACVHVDVCVRERKRGRDQVFLFFFFLMWSLSMCPPLPSQPKHTNAQKVMLSFTQLMVKQSKYNPSCHYCSDTDLIFVSLSLTPFYFPSLSALSLRIVTRWFFSCFLDDFIMES